MNAFIENLNGWGADFLRFAWPMLWQSSLLIAFVFVLDFLLARKIRAAVRYALWLAVLIKLLLPPALALPTGAAWWLFPAQPPPKAPVIKNYVVTYDTAPSRVDFPAQTFVMPEPPAPKMNGAGWALLVSAAVSAGLLFWLALRWWQVDQMVRRASVSGNILESLVEARRSAGLHSSARLKITDDRMSPAVCGLFRPVILLPRTLAEKLSPAQLRAVLLHELFHLRRKDVWVNCTQALLQVFYWWHPLLWVANARIRRLREEAVDDAVMLALRDDADAYAPTLLAVAKLAFHRPQMSLGLVGIMESRSALRQRIERLVEFRAPRKAGLTLVSLCGIVAFSAVALPMGEGPAPVDKQVSAGGAATQENSLTVKVDPEIFNRNVKAQAAKTLLPETDSYTEILLDLLRSEGVDCNPPHGLAFNHATGEITTQNTPDKLEIFRQVIEQLRRGDGVCELPLRHPPLPRKGVLIEAHVYLVGAGQFEKITAGLRRYSGGAGSDSWWSVPPGKVPQLIGEIEAAGFEAITRPRVLTSSGIPAIFYVGDGTNGTELACKPFAGDGFVDLTLHAKITSGAPTSAATNQVFSKVSAEDHGGIVLRMENSGGHDEKNFITVISVEIVTNAPAHFQQRLVPLGKPASAPPSGQALELVQSGKLFYEMGLLDAAEKKFQAVLAADAENASANYYLALIHTNRQNPKLVYTGPGRQQIVSKLQSIRLENFSTGDRGLPLNEVLRQLAGQSKLLDPERKGINFLINNNSDPSGQPVAGRAMTGFGGQGIDVNTGLPTTPAAGTAATTNEPVDVGSCLIKIPSLTNVCFADLLDAVVLVADHPIKYSVQDFAVVFSLKDAANEPLVTRTFKLDTNLLYTAVQTMGTLPAGSASEVMRSFLNNLGINMDSPKGKTLFYNESRGVFFVKATAEDLDVIEKAMRLLNQTSTGVQPQPAPLKNSTNGTGILSGTNFQVALRALQQRTGTSKLSEPEVTTSSGRGVNKIDLPPIFYEPTRTNIVAKLDRIRLEKFSTGNAGKPLREVLAQLNGESRWRDPERKGIDFVINPGGTNTGAPKDVGAVIIKIPELKDVRLADVLDAIVLVAEYPIKYSIRDSDVLFSAKHSETPQLFMRTFRVDTNIFLRSLENANIQIPGRVNSNAVSIGDGRPDGSRAVTAKTPASAPSQLLRAFFTKLGINLQEPPGKSVFYGDRLGVLFVKATESDLDTIERALQVVNQASPQIHIKARFYEVPKGTMLPKESLSYFQKFAGASNSAAQVVGILNATNARTAFRELQARSGIEVLAEPEVTTISGRQTQMRATQVISVVTNLAFQDAFTNQNGTTVSNSIVPQASQVETGPILDVVTYVLADGYTINLALIPSLTEFLGYEKSTNTTAAFNRAGEKIDVPEILPCFRTRQMVATVNLWDDQTVILAGLPEATNANGVAVNGSQKASEKELLVFVTATMVDPAGNRVHADDELPFAQKAVPPQPAPPAK